MNRRDGVRHRMRLTAWIVLTAVVLGACGGGETQEARPTTGVIADDHSGRLTASPIPPRTTPSPVPGARVSATPTEEAVIEVTVWPEDPRVPILAYHRFLPDTYAQSTAVKTRFSDLRDHLERLYAAGYSLIPLESWLVGDLRVPAGRRPLIITIDDAFFADQISLNEEGEPTPNSGIGVMYEFYREHPEFGFSTALFASLGDKLFLGGEEALAKAIVWGLEHGAIPYNHFYTHPRLDLTETRWITWEAEKNDLYLRELLASESRSDLAALLGNILALPYGIWPMSESGRDAVLGYVNPEGIALQAVMEVDYAFRAQLAEAPYTEGFNSLHVPRIVGTLSAIAVLEEMAEDLPVAGLCGLRMVDATPDIGGKWEEEIDRARRAGCGRGMYVIGNSVFDALGDDVKQIFIGPSSRSGSCGEACSH